MTGSDEQPMLRVPFDTRAQFGEQLQAGIERAQSEIWMADLAYYQSVREAKRRGRPGAETIYNDLRPRFPGSTPSNPTPVLPPPPPTGP